MTRTWTSVLCLLAVAGCWGAVRCDAERSPRHCGGGHCASDDTGTSDDVQALETAVSGLRQDMTLVQDQLSLLRKQHKRLKSRFGSSQTPVFFSAHRSADPFSVASYGTIVYDVADVNTGGGYDTFHGIFTCPVSGVYAFFVNCMAATGPNDMDVALVVDGKTLSGFRCFSYSNSGPDHGAGMTVRHLQAGQRVWTRLDRTARSVRGGPYTTFVGVMLKSDD